MPENFDVDMLEDIGVDILADGGVPGNKVDVPGNDDVVRPVSK